MSQLEVAQSAWCEPRKAQWLWGRLLHWRLGAFPCFPWLLGCVFLRHREHEGGALPGCLHLLQTGGGSGLQQSPVQRGAVLRARQGHRKGPGKGTQGQGGGDGQCTSAEGSLLGAWSFASFMWVGKPWNILSWRELKGIINAAPGSA